MTAIVSNLALAGYRSFGESIQYFDRFGKVNLFIGRNNAGKSNVLRFLTEVYPQISKQSPLEFDALAYHLPSRPPMIVGCGEVLTQLDFGEWVLVEDHAALQRIPESERLRASRLLARVAREKQRLDARSAAWTLARLPDRTIADALWLQATDVLGDGEAQAVWHSLTRMNNGERKRDWVKPIAKALMPQFPAVEAQLIPAIRQIGAKGSTSEAFDGNGIIERLARLQNPDVHSQQLRRRFDEINGFLLTPTEN